MGWERIRFCRNTDNAPVLPVLGRKNYHEAVRDFDLDGFKGRVVESGATFVVLTITWGKFFIPGKNILLYVPCCCVFCTKCVGCVVFVLRLAIVVCCQQLMRACVGHVEALEKRMNGRTTARDLIREMGEALRAVGVRLVLYYHYGAWPC